ncbi:MAG: molybdopterin biosynthesis protein [Armatimonadota bacterium]
MIQEDLDLALVPLDEAQERWSSEIDFKDCAKLAPEEKIKVEDSLDRITAENVMAKVSYPHFFMSGIDGIAVSSVLTYNASPATPVQLKMGEAGYFVDNGRQLPAGCDAVIPIERVKFHSLELIEITDKVTPWENIRPIGQEVAKQEIIIPKNSRIRSFDIGAMLSSGVDKIKVRKKPKIGIISVGDNLIPPGDTLEPGSLYESTSYILSNIIKDHGALSGIYSISQENLEDLNKIVSKAVEKEDMVIIIAGCARGTNLVADLMLKAGELAVFGTCMKPGQSVCAGFISDKCVIGVPHFPFSAYIAFESFILPVILRMQGVSAASKEKANAVLASIVNSPIGIDEFIRVQLVNVGTKMIAVPMSRGAELLMSLVKADGMLKISSEISKINAGSIVEVDLLTNRANIDKNLIMMGTYDFIWQIIRNLIYKLGHKVNLHTYNIGSRQGLKALKDGLNHFSGIHMFDSKSGEFNTPFVKDYLDDVPVIMVNLFNRLIGLVVKQGNPKNINGFEDLIREDVKFVNRNVGSGTRSIFDHALMKSGIGSQQISGYNEEINNHMAAAQVIASSSADAALGIYMSAKALDLDFIPVEAMTERYDIVIPKKFLNDHKIQVLLHLLNSKSFKKEVKDLKGYDFSNIGKVYYDSDEKWQ